jgi:hypothetical protein
MQKAKCIKESTNVRRSGEKVTHRCYSVDTTTNRIDNSVYSSK